MKRYHGTPNRLSRTRYTKARKYSYTYYVLILVGMLLVALLFIIKGCLYKHTNKNFRAIVTEDLPKTKETNHKQKKFKLKSTPQSNTQSKQLIQDDDQPPESSIKLLTE